MNQVYLQPDGRLLTDGRTIVTSPLACLGHRLMLADDCCLRGFFLLLDTYPVLVQLGDFYPLLMQQYRECPAQSCRWDGFDILVLSKTVEMVGYPGQPRLEIYNALAGFDTAQTRPPEQIRPLALAFLLDMPIRLGRLRHVVFGDRLDVFTFETIYTLFEFIDSIAWELSFHGIPQECQLRS